MNSPDFWKIISFIGLSDSGIDLDATKRRLLENYDRPTLEAASKLLEELQGELYKVVDEWAQRTDTELDLGDDSFSDLTYHIVGLGEAEYSAVLARPALAKARADRRDFSECFSGCFPWGDDFENLNVEKHSGEARFFIEHFESLLTALSPIPGSEESVRRVTAARDTLALLADGKIEDFFAAFDALDFKIVSSEGRPYGLNFGFRDLRMTPDERASVEGRVLEYIVYNLYSDAKAFLA